MAVGKATKPDGQKSIGWPSRTFVSETVLVRLHEDYADAVRVRIVSQGHNSVVMEAELRCPVPEVQPPSRKTLSCCRSRRQWSFVFVVSEVGSVDHSRVESHQNWQDPIYALPPQRFTHRNFFVDFVPGWLSSSASWQSRPSFLCPSRALPA
jgi:hypothetical protein